MKELTKAEEEVMQKLWQLEKAFVKDILEELKMVIENNLAVKVAVDCTFRYWKIINFD